MDITFKTSRTQKRKTRRFAGIIRKTLIAQSALTTGSHHHRHTGAIKVHDELAGARGNHGAHGNRQHNITGSLPVTGIPHPRGAILARAVRPVVIIQERGDLGIRQENNVSTVSPVTAVRASQRLELFATNGDTTITAVTGDQMQHYVIDKSCHVSPPLLAIRFPG